MSQMLLIPVISLIHIFKKMPVIIWRVKRLNYHVLIKLNFFNTDFCGCFSFGPQTFGPPQLVPKNKQSRLIWSPWTNGPQDYWSPWTIGPHGQMVPMDKWSPGQLVPLDKWSPNIWSPWTNGPPKHWSPWTIGP